MTKTSNFIISLLSFGFLVFLLSGFTNPTPAEALSIDHSDYSYQQACPVLSSKDLRTYGPGLRGQFVTALQHFLALEGTYDYGRGSASWAKSTGYYGPVTTKAVQDWQAKNNIVSSGSVYTTGYGNVGPRTRAAIADRCAKQLSVKTGQPSPYWGKVQATHYFDEYDQTHFIEGIVETGTPCYTIKVGEVVIRESLPELVTINLLASSNLASGDYCIQVTDQKPFSVDFQASELARITINVNGKEANVNLESGERSNLRIDEIDGPQHLQVGEEGRWELQLSGYAGTGVRYNVNWGQSMDYADDSADNSDAGYRKSKTATFRHTYDEPGTYRILFRVTDSEGNKALKTYDVEVIDGYPNWWTKSVIDYYETSDSNKPLGELLIFTDSEISRSKQQATIDYLREKGVIINSVDYLYSIKAYMVGTSISKKNLERLKSIEVDNATLSFSEVSTTH